MEKNDYVICMGCQNSFHMDECEPLEESGFGEVYCHTCLSKKVLEKHYYAQANLYAWMLKKCAPEQFINCKIAVLDKDNNILKILEGEL